jgi:LemA protein
MAALTTVNNAIQQFNQYAASNPQLQSSQAFTNLQYEMAGTENRIATERMRYNQAVEVYNRKIQSFPNSIVAGLTGFKAESFFEAETKTAPKF